MAVTPEGEGRRRALPAWLPVAGRLLVSVAVTILGLLIVTFLIGRVVPVDPVIAVAGDKLPQATYERIYHELGLDRPLWEQFGIYIGNVFRGDLGTSFLTKRPITTDIARFFPATLELATVGTLLGTVIGVPLGVLAAVRQGRISDQIVRVIGLIGYSAPIFWLGLLGLLLFYAKLHWVAGSGRIDYLIELDVHRVTGLLLIDTAMQRNWTAFRDVVAHIALPSMLLGYFSMAYISRMTRSFMLGEMAQEYVITARVKGVPERRIIFGHALRNAAVPLVTVIALSYAGLLEGSVLTETVFDWPGIGKYLTNSLQKADMNAVLGCTLLIGTIFIGINLLSDLLYRLLDPRVRRRA
jgi:peptide/nickel transport system permease protein